MVSCAMPFLRVQMLLSQSHAAHVTHAIIRRIGLGAHQEEYRVVDRTDNGLISAYTDVPTGIAVVFQSLNESCNIRILGKLENVADICDRTDHGHEVYTSLKAGSLEVIEAGQIAACLHGRCHTAEAIDLQIHQLACKLFGSDVGVFLWSCGTAAALS